MELTTVHNDDLELAAQTAQQAAQVLSAGGLVVFPTETVYGVAASISNSKSYTALQRLKGHTEPHPFAVHLPDPGAAERYVDLSSPMLRRLVHKVFPGPVTLIVEVTDDLVQKRLRALALPEEARGRIYFGNSVGLRCPDHPLAYRILSAVTEPVVASGANRPGQPAPHDAAEAAQNLGDAVDLVVDGGRSRFAKPSTIVRVRGTGAAMKVTVDRPGVYDERYIRKLLRWTMLLVCSGNTCRSPMAEGLARQLLAQERGLAADDLEAAGLRVLSAGAYATPGAPAACEAIEAMAGFEVDLSKHRSRRLTPELIHEADVIYCMTEAHRRSVLEMAPSAADKTHLLDLTGDIEDPIGSGLTVYRRCAELIRRRLAQRLKEQQL